MKKVLLFAATTLASVAVFAQDAAAIAATKTAAAAGNAHSGMVAIGAGIAIGLAVLGGTSAQGKAAASALEGMARNPGASDKMFTPFILALALIESLVILAFLVAFIKLPTGSFGF